MKNYKKTRSLELKRPVVASFFAFCFVVVGGGTFFFLLLLLDPVSLCSPNCPGTCYIDQADIQFKELCFSAAAS